MQTVHINTSIDYVTYCALFGYFHFPNTPFSIAFLFPVCKPAGNITQGNFKQVYVQCTHTHTHSHLQVKLTRVVSVLLSSDDSYISEVS